MQDQEKKHYQSSAIAIICFVVIQVFAEWLFRYPIPYYAMGIITSGYFFVRSRIG